MNRADAFSLLSEYTQSPSLIKTICSPSKLPCVPMPASLDRTKEKWGDRWSAARFSITEALAPIHPTIRSKGRTFSADRGYPDDVIYAIKSHAELPCPDCPRVHLLDKAPFTACDELGRPRHRCLRLVRPSGHH